MDENIRERESRFSRDEINYFRWKLKKQIDSCDQSAETDVALKLIAWVEVKTVSDKRRQ